MTDERRSLICAHCGQAIVNIRRKWVRFCSQKCRLAAWAAKHPRVKPVAGGGEANAAPADVQVDSAPTLHSRQVAALEARVLELEHLATAGRLHVRQPSAPETWKHGANCYRNHGCRCTVCVEGMRQRKR